MEILAASPFAVRGLVWEHDAGQHTLTVVCKVTYALCPGSSPVAPEREYINERDNHWDDDAGRSVYAPTDLVPFKDVPEVMLVGSAYAPRGEPVRSAVVRLAVGDVDKSFEVFGQRTLDREGEQTEGALWTQMPLRYERAAGGEGSWNPVGIDPDAVDSFGRRTLPNLAPLGADLDVNETMRAVGFGPLSPSWPVLRERLGRRAGSWSSEHWAETPLGDDFDGSYFQVAPEDQRLAVLRPDEPILLENLHPDHPRFVTKLAGVRPRVKVAPLGLPPWELTLTADTLWIDTNRSLCTLTWRGQVPLDEPDQPGTVLVGAEEPGKPVRWPSPAPRPSSTSGPAVASWSRPSTADHERKAALGDHGAGDDLHGHTFTDEGSFGLSTRGDGLPFQDHPRAGAPRVHVEPAHETHRVSTLPSEETGMLQLPPQRGSMPGWLGGGNASSESALFPAPPASTPAPPPPVGALLRPAGLTAFASAAAASDAAWQAPSSPPMKSSTSPSRPPSPSFGAADGRGSALASTAPQRPLVEEAARSSASYLGLLQASNAAASVTPADDDPSLHREARARAPVATSPRTLVDVIWFSPAVVGLLRDTPALAALLPAPPPSSSDEAVAAELLAKADRAAVGAVLARATPTVDVEAALSAAATEDGALRPMAVVVAGELELPFDEVERLRVVSSVAAPLAGTDKRLKEVLDMAKELLALPQAASAESTASMTDHIREAWSRANRLLRPDHLDTTSRRVLLEQRSYQHRELYDEPWIRALLTPPGSRAPIPTYLPASLAKALPLFGRFTARVVAEVVPQQDEAETFAVALRVGALGRTVPARGRPR